MSREAREVYCLKWYSWETRKEAGFDPSSLASERGYCEINAWLNQKFILLNYRILHWSSLILSFHLQDLLYSFWSGHSLFGVYKWVSGGSWILDMIWNFFMGMPTYILLGERICNFSKMIYVKKRLKISREFSGSPVVRTQCFHCRGPGLIPGRDN